MDWTKIKRNKAGADKPAGVYANLDDLIRIQFKARNFSFLPRQPVNSILSGRYASRLRGRGLNFEELRHYLPGDDIRTIDWKVTARTRSPHVRVYTEEKDRSVLLIVDQRMNMFFGTRDKLKSVTAAELSALGAWRAVHVGDRVGAIVFNDTDLVEIPPQRSQKTVMSILGAVLKMNHELRADSQVEPAPGALNRALDTARKFISHDTLVVVISDFSGVDQESERLTARIAEHNDVLALLVHDPMRLRPTARNLTVSDGSKQMDIDFSNKKLSEKIVKDYGDEQENITRSLRKLAAPLLMISNEGDVVDQVRYLLGAPGRAS
jgi:uncharacterized protein (DUF58 family)